MRSTSMWARQHRNGFVRAQAIVERQDRKPVLSPGSKTTIYKRDREIARRRRQIERGQLTIANGLAVSEE